MKWLIASDIHGSAYWCQRMLERADAEQVDRLLLLGDLLYHGPRNDLPMDYAPKRVIPMLSERSACLFCVQGNCDTEVDQMVLPFPIMADYALLEAAGRMIFATHGHVYHAGHLPPLPDGSILLHGHTHVPCCEPVGCVTVLNPGSVSIPKQNSRHSCMVMEDGLFRWLDVENGETWKTWSADESSAQMYSPDPERSV